MKVHLFNVSQDEAETSLEHHGDPVCGSRNCGAEAVLAVLIKPPNAKWGQQISCSAACAKHRAEIGRAHV